MRLPDALGSQRVLLIDAKVEVTRLDNVKELLGVAEELLVRVDVLVQDGTADWVESRL